MNRPYFLIALALTFVLLAPRPALAEEGVSCTSADTAATFPDDPTRNQCTVDCCHSFASVAMVESALSRDGKRDPAGKRLVLSEADLFVQKTLLPQFAARKARGILTVDKRLNETCPNSGFIESGNIEDDIDFILEHGIAFGETAGFALFEAEYTRHKRDHLLNLFDPEAALVGGPQLSPNTAAPMSARGRKTATSAGGAPAPKTRLPLKERLAKLYLERKLVHGYLAGFKREKARFVMKWGGAWSALYNDPKACREHGRSQRQWLLQRLCAGVPAGVSMELDGLPQWGPVDGSHAFVISAVRKEANGFVFSTRNSWGGKNPDVAEDQLCRVSRGVTLATPKEIRDATVVPVPEPEPNVEPGGPAGAR